MLIMHFENSTSLLLAGIAAAGLAAGNTAFAAAITMEGDYVLTAISDNGTLGAGGTTSPGIKHDITGTGTWGAEDYLTPGSPFEFFGVTTDQTGSRGNNNIGSTGITTTSAPLDMSGIGADNRVTWAGELAGFFSISHDYSFNDDEERIDILTSITALTDLTGVEFLRAIDPDPDVNTFGSFVTVNSRGRTGVSEEDFVNSQGASTGLTLGLFTDSSITHNTGISDLGWTTSASYYLDGNDAGDGDFLIGMGFDMGSLFAGDQVQLNYSYVMGETLDTIDIPANPIPEPGTLALLGLGLTGVVASRRRAKKH
jgi:hypothetical protein